MHSQVTKALIELASDRGECLGLKNSGPGLLEVALTIDLASQKVTLRGPECAGGLLTVGVD